MQRSLRQSDGKQALEAGPAIVEDQPQAPSLLDRVCGATVARAGAHVESTRAATSHELDAFLQDSAPLKALIRWMGSLPTAGHVKEWLTTAFDRLARDAAQIDQMVGGQVNAILHTPKFQSLEASWCGLHWLLEKASESSHTIAEEESSGRLVLKVLSVSKKELLRDSQRSRKFDESRLFNKVYEEEYGSYGGEPFGLLIGDYEFTDEPNDISLLRHISAVAASAFAPFVSAAHPSLLGLEDFSELQVPQNLAETFRAPRRIPWKSLRESEDARFLGLTLPRVLMRLPYANDGSSRHGFRFEEDVRHLDRSRYLWGNSAYAFASVVMRAYATSGWFADIRGFQRGETAGGVVVDLPAQSFGTDAHGVALKTSVDAVFDTRRERELSELGFIPLCPCKDTAFSVYYSNTSIQQPKAYLNEDATRNARISSMLQYILCASRFAHYLKAILQRHLGAGIGPEQLENELTNWLARYVFGNPFATAAEKAANPLREGRVRVETSPAEPGKYRLVAQLQPHYQLDDLHGVLTLRTNPFSSGPH